MNKKLLKCSEKKWKFEHFHDKWATPCAEEDGVKQFESFRAATEWSLCFLSVRVSLLSTVDILTWL